MLQAHSPLRRALLPLAAVALLAAAAVSHAQSAAPSLTITVPSNGAMLLAAEFESIDGTVLDTAGAGISWVGFSLRREGTNLEWDGEGAWVPGPTGAWLMAKVRDQTWKARAGAMPPPEKLEPGLYVVTVHARDKEGNTSEVSAAFTIQPQVLLQ